LLGDPVSGGAGGGPGEVPAATVVLDHEEDVEAAQEDGVDVGEVDGEDGVGLGGQELAPGRPGPSGRGIEPAFFRIFQTVEAATAWPSPTNSPWMRLQPHRGFSRGHPQHQGPDRRWGRWSARLSARVGPAASDELGVPMQQGSG
jgi:hypothetical protein